jgi:hypothetical protein
MVSARGKVAGMMCPANSVDDHPDNEEMGLCGADVDGDRRESAGETGRMEGGSALCGQSGIA